MATKPSSNKPAAKKPAAKKSAANPGRAKQYVYFFGNGHADGNRGMKDLLGGKGAGLAEMTNAGLPVPPGFTISTDVCGLYYREKAKIPSTSIVRSSGSSRSSNKPPARNSDRVTTRCSCRCGRARSSRCPA